MSLSSVSFGSAPVGATSPVSKGKAASSSRDEGALTSFGMTLQGMTDKANAQALAAKAAAASAANSAVPRTSVHDAPKPEDKSASDSSSDADETQAAGESDQAGKSTNASSNAGKTDKPDASTDAANAKGPRRHATHADANADAKAAADAAAALAKARADAANAGDASAPTLADLATAAESTATAAADASGTSDTATTPGSTHKSADSKSAQDALQAALAAMNNPASAVVPAPQANASASAATANAAGNADSGSAKAGQTIGLGAVLGDGKNADALGSPASPNDAASLANAQAASLAVQPDDSTAAYKQAADASAHASALQAASAASANSAATNVQGTLASATSAAIAPHVGSSGWDDAFSQKVVFLSNAHTQSAELTLNPKDLGPLQVVLQVADNHAHALFVSQHAQVREAVEAALPKLREAMEANGIGLGSTSVSDGFARQSGQSAGRDSGRGGRDAGSGGIGDAGGVGGAALTASVPLRRTVGLVDTFA